MYSDGSQSSYHHSTQPGSAATELGVTTPACADNRPGLDLRSVALLQGLCSE